MGLQVINLIGVKMFLNDTKIPYRESFILHDVFWPPLPLSAKPLSIDRNLLQAFGDTELATGQKPKETGSGIVLM